MYPQFHRPSNCPDCRRVRQHLVDSLARSRAALSTSERKIPVLTWCCVCGVPVALGVEPYYKFALHEFIMLDRTKRHHRHHAEDGGWGIHWRLDEVLEVAFPQQHMLPRFPRPPWYEHSQALEFEVRVMTEHDKRIFAKQVNDPERRMLHRWINEHCRTPEEMRVELANLKMSTETWGPDELRERFEVLYFEEPFVVVVDRISGEKGSLMFQHKPRIYFGFDTTRPL